MQLLLKILVFFILFLVLFSLFTFLVSIHPKKIKTDLSPDELGLEYEEISFKSTDGIRLSGWFFPNNNSRQTVIVMHGYPADKANLLGVTEFLAKDFNVLLFDFRSFGKSEGKYTTAGYLERNDLLGAIQYLEEEKNLTKIGLYGFSLGGAVALMTNHKNIKAVATDSAYARLQDVVLHMYGPFSILKYPLALLTKLYGILFLRLDLDDASPAENIKNMKIPILLIHSEIDSQIPVGQAFILHEVNKKTSLWIVKDADHGMIHSAHPEEYEKRIIDFFRKNIN